MSSRNWGCRSPSEPPALLSTPRVASRPVGLRSVCPRCQSVSGSRVALPPRSEGPVLGPGLRVGGTVLSSCSRDGCRGSSETSLKTTLCHQDGAGHTGAITETRNFPGVLLKSQHLLTGTVASPDVSAGSFPFGGSRTELVGLEPEPSASGRMSWSHTMGGSRGPQPRPQDVLACCANR